MKKYLIITGGNKGIGSGIVSEYKKQSYQIISISRSLNQSIEYESITQIELNLNKLEGVEHSFLEILNGIDKNTLDRIVLINNAGTLGKVCPIEKNTAEEILNSIHLNTVTPFLLSSLFIKATQSWNCTKKIINISSGAAIKPYFGWSVYCASKAALDMMTRTIALEQQTLKNGVKIIAIYPGVVDTDMQNELRNSKLEDFVDLQRFLDLKESGALVNVKTVGEEIFSIDNQDNYTNGSILNVADYR